MNSPPTFHLKLLGTPSIGGDDGQRLGGRVSQRHRLALLALMAMSSERRMSRDKAVTWLWPESDTEKGRNLLSVAVYVIRTALGDSALVSEGDDLRLDDRTVTTDVGAFDSALARSAWADAAALYAGPFLDGFFLTDAPEFEQWVSRERDRLASDYRRALEALASEAESANDFTKAAEWWNQRAVQDPYDSRVAVRLMQALDRSGNRAGALQHASIHQRLLKQEFGIGSAEVSAGVEALRNEGERVIHAPSPLASFAAITEAGVLERDLPMADPPAVSCAAEVDEECRPGSTEKPPPAARVRSARRRRLPMASLIATTVVVIAALSVWRFAPWSTSREPSIAVLPFADLSPAGDNEYFSDGLTEEIITGLSGVPELKVISRTSAMHYRGSAKPLRRIAEELGVAHVLEGSVRRSGDRVRISAQLIDARTDEHLWAQSYDDDLRDIFAVQEQIARQVVQALKMEIADGEERTLVHVGTRDPEAYQLYQRARYLWNMRTREGHDRAITYFQQALARDSGFADAYAGLAVAHLTAVQLNATDLPPEESYARATRAIERALALDDKSADAYAALAMSRHWQHDWPGAERAFLRALAINPNHASAHSWYSLLLSGMGQGKAALQESRRAYELDPFAVVMISNYGWQCHLSRDVECAIEQFKRTTEIGTTYGRGYQRLALAYTEQGRLDEALASVQRAIELTPERGDFMADLAYIRARRGERALANEALQLARQDMFEPFSIARAYVALGEADSAFAWLDRSSWHWSHRADRRDPALDPVRSDARFIRLSARVDREMSVPR